MCDTDCGLPNRLLLAGRESLTEMLGIGGWGREDGAGSAYGSTGSDGVEDALGKAYGSAGTGGTVLAAGADEGVLEAVLTLLNGLRLANGPFGVPGRPLPNVPDELDGPNSLSGAGEAAPDRLAGLSKGLADLLAGLSKGLADRLAGLSKGLGAAPDLLVGLSKRLFRVGTKGSVTDFSNGAGAGAGAGAAAGSGFGSAGKMDFSSFSSTTP